MRLPSVRKLPLRLPAALPLALAAACASYEAHPLDPDAVLTDLSRITWTPPEEGPGAATPELLASFAISTNPRLRAIRSAIDVQRSLLVEAGLFPDPELGWDGMDTIASQIIDSRSSAVDVLSGLGILFPLPRPGELSARKGAARMRVEEARRRTLAAEWALAREVYIAYQEVLTAQDLLEQSRALVELGASTEAYFERAQEAGSATAIQANLARGDWLTLGLDLLEGEARLTRAWQSLDRLLGLPPDARFELARVEPTFPAAPLDDPQTLVKRALEERPDIAARRAAYQAAEEEVRLAVSERFPSIAIGTGIQLTLPLFSRFGRVKTLTAIARRERLHLEFIAAVHALRAEISSTFARWQAAQRELRWIDEKLLPNAEENYELAQEAFRAGEITLLETLAMQRALVVARTRHSETRAELIQRAWELSFATGMPTSITTPDSTPEEESVR